MHIGEYRISALLGEGGQGTVYLGIAPNGARVAIKVLLPHFASDPQTCRRFLREAEVAASVAAFCTAKIVATGMYGTRPYIVSEYVPGPSLDVKVKTEGPRTGSGLERLAVSTLTALASIHAAGVVHRDFKPGNVILGPEGPVVIDFGIARALDMRTNTTRVVGTPAYMAPEQLTDEPVTAACDVFSWGSTMTFAATGRLAFSGTTIPAILHAILYTEPDLTDVPHPLRELVAAALAKNPAARPSAAALLSELTGGRSPFAVPAGYRTTGRAGHAPAGAGLLTGGHAAPIPPATPIPPGPITPAEPPRAPQSPAPQHPAQQPPHPGPQHPADRSGGPPGRTAEPATWPSAPGAHRKPLRRPPRAVVLAAAAAAVAVVAAAGLVVVPSWLGGDSGNPPGAQAAPAAASAAGRSASASAAPAQELDLAAFPRVDVNDRFSSPADVQQYTSHQPEENEVVPSIATEDGVFSATGATPYFTMLSGPALLPGGKAISVITVGRFVDIPQLEDSVFVGWVKDGNNYVAAWYNNNRRSSGLNIRLGGELHESPTTTSLELREGDRFALVLDGQTITSYAETGGRWRRLQAATIGGLLAGAASRQDYRYGFGLRASQGTITVTAAEGRSAP